MRILMVGAGALGGYIGARLVEAGRDVTILVRPRRGEQSDRVREDADRRPRTVVAGDHGGPYDLVLLAVKAYLLDAAMDDIAAAVGPATAILPVVNGLRHLDTLTARFGPERVLGGASQIAATLGPEGQVLHGMPRDHDLIFGEVHGGTSTRVRAIASTFRGAKFVARTSEQIMQEMWEQWIVLATLAGMTCLMRASVGDILASPGGRDAILSLLAECRAVARAAGHEPRPAAVKFVTGMLKDGSPLAASMLTDIERVESTEGEYILGDMVERAERMGVSTPILKLARGHVAAYSIRRRREQAER